METILGKKSQEKTIADFESKLIRTGKLSENSIRILRGIVDAKAEFKKGKSSTNKIEEARKGSAILINELIDYSQRKDLAVLDKTKMRIKYSDSKREKHAELIAANGNVFLIKENKIQKITNKILDSNLEELSHAVEEQKNKKSVQIGNHVFELLKKELGDFQIVL